MKTVIALYLTAILVSAPSPPLLPDAISSWNRQRNVFDFMTIVKALPRRISLTNMKQYLGESVREELTWSRLKMSVFLDSPIKCIVHSNTVDDIISYATVSITFSGNVLQNESLRSWRSQRNAYDFAAIIQTVKGDTPFKSIKELLGDPVERDTSVAGGGSESWIFYKDSIVTCSVFVELRGGEFYKMSSIMITQVNW